MRILLVAILLVFLSPTQAQVIYGSLVGSVTDPSGATVKEAVVTTTNSLTGTKANARTNDDGSYSFPALQPGNYTINIAVKGFRPVRVLNVTISANTEQRVDRQLVVASASDEVIVSTAPPPLQTEKADVNYEVTSEMMEDLPTTSTTGRNFQSLYQLVPGATPPAEQNSAQGNPQRSQAFNVNGAANISNSTRIDGTINTFPWIPYVIAYVPPQEAIGSVNFSTNAYNAEQGFAGGAAVNVIIKSGTNKFHGSLFEYNQSSPYNAKTWRYQQKNVPKNMFNEFGGSIGGPIFKDKLFFFFDIDRFTQRKTLSSYFTIPDKNSALAQGDFTGTNIKVYDPNTGLADGSGRTQFANNKITVNPVAQTLISLLPAPNVPGAVGPLATSNYFATSVYSFDRYHTDFKVNYNPNSRTTAFGRYSMSPATINDPQALGAAGGIAVDSGQPGIAQSRIQNVGVGFTYTFNSRLFMDANGGYTRQYLASTPDGIGNNYGTDVLKIPGTNGTDPLYGGIPLFQFAVSGTFASLGNAATASPSLIRDNQFSYNVNVTYLAGKHSFRWGAEYTHGAINHFQLQGNYGARGGFAFTGGVTALKGGAAPNLYNTLADFMLGLPQNFGKATAFQNPNALRFSSWGFYVQDKYQLAARLTLTYGIRYELYPFAHRDHSGAYRYDPTTGNVLIGGRGGVPDGTGIQNGWGMIVPRFGVNYRLDNHSVIRTGFGMTVDPDNFRFLRDSYPAVILQSFNGANGYSAAGCLNTDSYVPLGGCLNNGIPQVVLPNINAGKLPLPAAVSTNTVPGNYRRGYLYTYNLAVEREFPGKFVATTTYVGLRQVRAVSPLNINASPVGTGAAGRPLNKIFGQTADIFSATPSGSVNYNGLQAQLSNRAKRNAQFGIIYTWSHSFDISDNSTYGTVLFADPAFYKRNYATSGYDRTNNLQIWSILISNVSKKDGWMHSAPMRAILSGWRLSNTFSKVSGTPLTIVANTTSLNAPGSTQVADQIKPYVTIYGAHGKGNIYFDQTAFAQTTQVRYGTAARNSLRGPGYFRLDAALFRSFPIWHEYTFRFGVESFDITNSPVFSNPNVNASGGAGFGQISQAYVNRTMRLSGRIQF